MFFVTAGDPSLVTFMGATLPVLYDQYLFTKDGIDPHFTDVLSQKAKTALCHTGVVVGKLKVVFREANCLFEIKAGDDKVLTDFASVDGLRFTADQSAIDVDATLLKLHDNKKIISGINLVDYLTDTAKVEFQKAQAKNIADAAAGFVASRDFCKAHDALKLCGSGTSAHHCATTVVAQACDFKVAHVQVRIPFEDFPTNNGRLDVGKLRALVTRRVVTNSCVGVGDTCRLEVANGRYSAVFFVDASKESESKVTYKGKTFSFSYDNYIFSEGGIDSSVIPLIEKLADLCSHVELLGSNGVSIHFELDAGACVLSVKHNGKILIAKSDIEHVIFKDDQSSVDVDATIANKLGDPAVASASTMELITPEGAEAARRSRCQKSLMSSDMRPLPDYLVSDFDSCTFTRDGLIVQVDLMLFGWKWFSFITGLEQSFADAAKVKQANSGPFQFSRYIIHVSLLYNYCVFTKDGVYYHVQFDSYYDYKDNIEEMEALLAIFNNFFQTSVNEHQACKPAEGPGICSTKLADTQHPVTLNDLVFHRPAGAEQIAGNLSLNKAQTLKKGIRTFCKKSLPKNWVNWGIVTMELSQDGKTCSMHWEYYKYASLSTLEGTSERQQLSWPASIP